MYLYMYNVHVLYMYLLWLQAYISLWLLKSEFLSVLPQQDAWRFVKMLSKVQNMYSCVKRVVWLLLSMYMYMYLWGIKSFNEVFVVQYVSLGLKQEL